jgi:hypothetical protein
MLYFARQKGKKKGADEMKLLCNFLKNTLELKNIKQQEDSV